MGILKAQCSDRRRASLAASGGRASLPFGATLRGVPGRGWRGAVPPSDPPNGNGTSWTLDAGGGLAALPSRRPILMADRRTVVVARFAAEND